MTTRSHEQVSDTRFRRLADALPQLLWVATTDGVVTYVNARREDYARLEEATDAGVAARWRLMLHPDDLQPTATAWRAAMQRGTTYEHEHRLRMLDGSFRWHLSRARVVVEDDGTRLWYGTATDIHDLKVAQQQLEISERRVREQAEELDTILRNVPAAIWMSHDPECRLITGNAFAEQLVEVRPSSNVSASSSAAVGERPFVELRDGQPVAPEELPLQRASRTGEPVRDARLSFQFADGRVKHVLGNATPLRDASGAVRGAISAFIDVTEARESSKALSARERELQALVDNSPDIIARVDRAYRHVFVNHRATQVTGRSVADYIGCTNRELGMPAALCDSWDVTLRRVFETGEPGEAEFDFPTADGTLHFASRLVPEFDDQGLVQHVLAITSDITERKRAERELRVADRRKDEFLATLAHELRNPLAPMLNALVLLQGSTSDATTAQRANTIIDRQLRQMVHLIDDLMDVSRINQDKVVLRREVTDFTRILDAALEASLPVIDSRRHALQRSLPGEALIVNADVTRLAQVLVNLLNNAAKYTEPGGTIRLEVTVQNGALHISVQDNGIGIMPGQLGRLFDMFSQEDDVLTRAAGGLGIGLFLVKRLVELHGGTVTARSDGRGRGSVFHLTLPILVEAASTTATPAGSAGSALDWQESPA